MNEPGKVNAPGRRQLAWRLFIAALVLSVVAEFFLGSSRRFGTDDWFAAGAWFSFLACVLFVGLARLVGLVARRPERYYEDRDA